MQNCLVARAASACLAACTFVALMHAPSAHASALRVYPLKLELNAVDRSTLLTAENTSDRDMLFEAKVVSWRQVDGKPVTEPTRDLLVNPPIVRVAAGREQTFRIGSRRAPDPQHTLAYRVIVSQVPDESLADGQVSFMVGMSVPLFLRPVRPATHALRWHAQRKSANELLVTAANSGLAPAPLAAFDVLYAGELVGELLAGNWVLTDGWQRWPVALTRPLPENAQIEVVWTHRRKEMGRSPMRLDRRPYDPALAAIPMRLPDPAQ